MIRHEKPKTASSLLLPLLVFLASTTSSSIRCAHASSACGSASHSSTRRLSHPCGNSASGSSSTTAALYNENSLRQGGNTLLEVTMGTIAALLTILGVLFLIDREAFDAITCKTGERVCRRRVSTSA
ncbi:hypothetical protein ACHAXA_006254 [Cyclostephanos tholiformis]|uniref:Uncharacterized protein n=1 Tax=Cyclostephanos tholiformis TaxID=382380 RepID=A0ABD3SPD9_9STRA